MSASDRFNLIDSPWLPVRTTAGHVEELSLVDAFRSAHRMSGLVGEVSTQVFCLTRLLLAILHRSVGGPSGIDDWEDLWTADGLPVGAIEDYLARHRDRFDLAHPEKPFFQVASLRTKDDKVSDLSKLIADVPNGHPFFTTRIGGRLRLGAAEAARWLVHCHAFDPSGIKSGDPSDPRTKGGKGYPIGVGWSGNLGGILVGGKTLRDTLLLNLVPRDADRHDPERDLPPWERPHLGVTEEQEDREPRGPVDLFTWQSRRVRLVWENDQVTGVLIANGDRRTPQNMHPHEPHTGWRRSPAQEKKLRSSQPVYMPLEHHPERSIWRGLQSMLPDAAKSDGSARLTATVLDWISALTNMRVLDKTYPLSVRTIGMAYGSQNSTVADVIDDALSLKAVLFAQDAGELIAVTKTAVEHSEAGATAIGRFAENLAVASGSRDPDGPRARAIEYAYGVLDPLFRAWLAQIGPSSDEVDILAEWHRTAAGALRDLATELHADASPAAWTGRPDRKGKLITSNHAWKWCEDALRATFPYAFDIGGSTS